jgi:uncharacterized protein (TIGR03435 family)
METTFTRGLLVVLASCCAFGQSSVPAFEVASVKPNNLGTRGFIGALPSGKDFRGFTATNGRLTPLIMMAYGINDRQLSLKGAPEWIGADGFDIDAKADKPASYEQIQLMMQTLLADRFKLKLHRETREERIYALIVDKDPPDFLPHNDDGSPPLIKPGDKPGELVFQNVPLARLVMLLSGETGRAVVDKTGLKGSFDFKLEWNRSQSKGPRDDSDDGPGPSIVMALRKQLGLKLESQRGPVEYISIEHVEKPSGN